MELTFIVIILRAITSLSQQKVNMLSPAASSPVTARPHFPVLNNADVARQENFFLKGLRSKASIKVMAGDGACFFRSISDQLHQDGGEGHAALREGACDWIEANKQQYTDFFLS